MHGKAFRVLFGHCKMRPARFTLLQYAKRLAGFKISNTRNKPSIIIANAGIQTCLEFSSLGDAIDLLRVPCVRRGERWGWASCFMVWQTILRLYSTAASRKVYH